MIALARHPEAFLVKLGLFFLGARIGLGHYTLIIQLLQPIWTYRLTYNWFGKQHALTIGYINTMDFGTVVCDDRITVSFFIFRFTFSHIVDVIEF